MEERFEEIQLSTILASKVLQLFPEERLGFFFFFFSAVAKKSLDC